MAVLTSTGVNFSDGSTINGTTFNTVGSCMKGANLNAGSGPATLNPGSTMAGSAITQNVLGRFYCSCGGIYYYAVTSNVYAGTSGTWRYMGGAPNSSLWVRVS